jgi:hypothetical protein
MNDNSFPGVESIIREYLETKDRWLLSGRKSNDAQKEYNKLLAKFSGEHKNYTLEQADKIYKAHQDMTAYGEESKHVETKFKAAEEKLKEVGRILFEPTIHADVLFSPANGDAPITKSITINFDNGQVIVG